MAKKNAQIIEIREMMGETGLVIIEQIEAEPLRELRECFDTLEDKRFEPCVEHLLSDIVMITLLAIMAWANEWNEIAEFARMKERWLRGFLVLPRGIPSHETIQRVMPVTARQRRLEREGALAGAEAGPNIIAIDGKTSRGSKRNKTDREAVKGMHTVSAYSMDRGLHTR